MGIGDTVFDALGLSWLDKLTTEQAMEWANLKARVTALLDDLARITEGFIPLSVPDAEPNRVIAWADTEKRNLDRFGDNVLFSQNSLGVIDGVRLRWDLSTVKSQITTAQAQALSTMQADVTMQEPDPELEGLGLPPEDFDFGPVFALGGVLLGVWILGIMFTRG